MAQHRVDYGRDYLLPIRAEIELSRPQRIALPRAVEDEAIVASRQRAGAAQHVHRLLQTVGAVVQYDERPAPARAVRTEEPACQGGIPVRYLHPLHRRGGKRGGAPPPAGEIPSAP